MDVTEKKRTSPIMKMMGGLHYYQKFIIISLLFGLAIIVSLYFMASPLLNQVRTTNMQITGLEYLSKVEVVIGNIMKHREMLIKSKEENAALRNEILGIQSEISNEFRALIQYDGEVQEKLETTNVGFQLYEYPNVNPNQIEKKWQKLASQAFELSPEELNKTHLTILDELFLLMSYITDKSGLLLDSEQKTYNLLVANAIYLPSSQNLIPKTSSLLFEETNKETLLNLAAYAGQIKFILDRTRQSIENSYHDTSENEIENRLREPLRQYVNTTNDYLNFITNFITEGGEELSLEEFMPTASKVITDNFILSQVTYDQIFELLNQRNSSVKFRLYSHASIILLIAVVGFLFGIHVLGEAMSPIYTILSATEELAQGNLTTRVPVVYDDTIGQVSTAINTVAESFQQLIGQLQWTGIQLTTSTTEIAAAAKQQEATVIQQEATTKEIAVTAREISATAKDFARTMSEVSLNAEQTSSLASSGKQALEQMQNIMHQLVDASGSISSKLGALNEKAGTITGVVTTITKVADQTNLLSLNAAIEAEKAGEHGRSFAVIAREIRRLADQTANATYDIEKMVTEMVSAVSAGVMGVDKFSAEINNAVDQVNTVSEHLTQIIEQVQQQTSSFESVNQGMQAQSLGAEQINESIIQLSEVAQQTADSIRQFHKAVEQLNNAAQEMQNSVAKLQH